MREILFRGKTTDLPTGFYDHDYAFGDLVRELETGKTFILDLSHFDKTTKLSDLLIEVDPETVGQFTGLLDKNGTKIFEGDIVKADWGKIPMKIKWDDSGFAWEASVIDAYNGWCLDDLNPCEVIGNITDNPELLEETK